MTDQHLCERELRMRRHAHAQVLGPHAPRLRAPIRPPEGLRGGPRRATPRPSPFRRLQPDPSGRPQV